MQPCSRGIPGQTGNAGPSLLLAEGVARTTLYECDNLLRPPRTKRADRRGRAFWYFEASLVI